MLPCIVSFVARHAHPCHYSSRNRKMHSWTRLCIIDASCQMEIVHATLKELILCQSHPTLLFHSLTLSALINFFMHSQPALCLCDSDSPLWNVASLFHIVFVPETHSSVSHDALTQFKCRQRKINVSNYLVAKTDFFNHKKTQIQTRENTPKKQRIFL